MFPQTLAFSGVRVNLCFTGHLTPVLWTKERRDHGKCSKAQNSKCRMKWEFEKMFCQWKCCREHRFSGPIRVKTQFEWTASMWTQVSKRWKLPPIDLSFSCRMQVTHQVAQHHRHHSRTSDAQSLSGLISSNCISNTSSCRHRIECTIWKCCSGQKLKIANAEWNEGRNYSFQYESKVGNLKVFSTNPKLGI